MMRPEKAMRTNPLLTAWPRVEGEWVYPHGLRYFHGRVFCACGFSIPVVPFGGWWCWCSPTSHLPGWAPDFSCTLKVVLPLSSPFAHLWDYITGILLCPPSTSWNSSILGLPCYTLIVRRISQWTQVTVMPLVFSWSTFTIMKALYILILYNS